MDKIIQPHGWMGTQGDHLSLFEILDPYNLRHGAIEKIASCGVHPDIERYIQGHILTIHPREDRYTYILCSNMGAGETWGSNINADRFLRSVLAYKGTDWGVQTFLKAGIYKHHVNKDPAKSYGDITYVLFAPAPQYMDRVESIVRLDRERANRVGADDVIQAIDRGEFISWSMGCRVEYDVCSYCGNQAKTRKNYCTHMLRYPNMIITADFFGRKGFEDLTPDKLGLRICVDNPKPKFFDFSRVWIGAAPEAKTLRKVAEIGGGVISSAELAEMIMKGAADKSADITKRVEGDDTDLIGKSLRTFSKGEEMIPDSILDRMGESGLGPALSTTTRMGIVLKPREFQRVYMVSKGKKPMADVFDSMRTIFPPTSHITPCHSELAGQHFVEALAHLLMSFVSKRSVYGPVIRMRMVQTSGRKSAPDDLKEHDTEELRKISSLYNGYRLGLLEKISSSGPEFVFQNPAMLRAVYDDPMADLMLGITKQAEDLISLPTVAYLLHADGVDIPNLLQQSPGVASPFLRKAAQAL